MENNDTITVQDAESAFKQKLGAVGRQLKKLDLRTQIVDYPFAAVGIAAAVGAIVGAVRPKPQVGRFSSLLMTTLGAIGFRLVREAAVQQLGIAAKNYIAGTRAPQNEGFASAPPAKVEGGNVRYTL
jgi:hypothetical protein